MVRLLRGSIQPSKTLSNWCNSEDIEVDGKKQQAAEYIRFVRIGEEMDDNEVEGYGFDIHIERSLQLIDS